MKYLWRALGLIAACVMVVFALGMINDSKDIDLPKKHVYVSSSSSAYYSEWEANQGAQYLGGDAYNYIVEASLKAGYYDAQVTRKTILEVGGYLLLSISGFFGLYCLAAIGDGMADDKQIKIMKKFERVIGKKDTTDQDAINESCW